MDPRRPKTHGTLVMEPEAGEDAPPQTVVLAPTPVALEEEAPPETVVLAERPSAVPAPFPIASPRHVEAPGGEPGTPWADVGEDVDPADGVVHTVSFRAALSGAAGDDDAPDSVPPPAAVRHRASVAPPAAVEPEPPSVDDLLPPSDPWGARLDELGPRSAHLRPPPPPPPANPSISVAKRLYAGFEKKKR